MNEIKLRKTANIKIYSETGRIPQYGTSGSAAFDIEAKEDFKWELDGDFCIATIKTGLYTKFDSDYVLKIYPRSGLGFKYQVELVNSTGIIDSDYRGEISVKLRSRKKYIDKLPTKKFSRIAQGILEEIPKVNFEALTKKEFQYLKNNEVNLRGENGFGSTGITEK